MEQFVADMKELLTNTTYLTGYINGYITGGLSVYVMFKARVWSVKPKSSFTMDFEGK